MSCLHRAQLCSVLSDSHMHVCTSLNTDNFVAMFCQTDYPNAPMEHACPLLPCGDFGPNGAQLAWLEADLAQVCWRFPCARVFVCARTPLAACRCMLRSLVLMLLVFERKDSSPSHWLMSGTACYHCTVHDCRRMRSARCVLGSLCPVIGRSIALIFVLRMERQLAKRTICSKQLRACLRSTMWMCSLQVWF